MALSGVDLVVEPQPLPAYHLVIILQHLQLKSLTIDIDTIAFGSEIDNLARLEKVATNINALEQSSLFQDLIKQGKHYAKIIDDLVEDPDVLRSPNNILGVAYIKAINTIDPTINKIAIQRQSATHHDQDIKHDTFASGSAIRRALINNNHIWKDVVPSI